MSADSPDTPEAVASTPDVSPAPTAPDTDLAAPPAEPSRAAEPMSLEACAAQLKQLFPALFRGSPKPIKLRIQADIQQRAPGQFTKQVLSAFLRRFTSSTSYLIALSNATQRFDLDGQPAGDVSEEHRQAAQQELARRRANQQARRDQEVNERRERAALLRDFETTRLTTPNFCALKGIEPEALDGLLALARKEAAEAPPPFVREARDRRPPRGPIGSGRPGGTGPGPASGPRGPREGGRPSGPRGKAGGARKG
jgi:hypothetical protein